MVLTVIAIEILLHTKKSYPIVCAKKGTLLAAAESTGKRGILRLFFFIFCRFSFNLLIHNNQWELSFQKYNYSPLSSRKYIRLESIQKRENILNGCREAAAKSLQISSKHTASKAKQKQTCLQMSDC